MNWIRLLRTTVTHHRKLEQVDIHLQKKGFVRYAYFYHRHTRYVFRDFYKLCLCLKPCWVLADLFCNAQDMLHASILPHEELWRRCAWLQNHIGNSLKFFIVFLEARRSAMIQILFDNNTAEARVGSYLLSTNCITTRAWWRGNFQLWVEVLKNFTTSQSRCIYHPPLPTSVLGDWQ